MIHRSQSVIQINPITRNFHLFMHFSSFFFTLPLLLQFRLLNEIGNKKFVYYSLFNALFHFAFTVAIARLLLFSFIKLSIAFILMAITVAIKFNQLSHFKGRQLNNLHYFLQKAFINLLLRLFFFYKKFNLLRGFFFYYQFWKFIIFIPVFQYLALDILIILFYFCFLIVF